MSGEPLSINEWRLTYLHIEDISWDFNRFHITLWLFNIAVEHCLFIGDFPINTTIFRMDSPWLCLHQRGVLLPGFLHQVPAQKTAEIDENMVE